MQLKSQAGHRLRDIVGAKLTKRQLSIQFIVAVLNRRAPDGKKATTNGIRG